MNEPEVVAYHQVNKTDPNLLGVSLHYDPSCTNTLNSVEPLVRLSDCVARVSLLEAQLEAKLIDCDHQAEIIERLEAQRVPDGLTHMFLLNAAVCVENRDAGSDETRQQITTKLLAMADQLAAAPQPTPSLEDQGKSCTCYRHDETPGPHHAALCPSFAATVGRDDRDALIATLRNNLSFVERERDAWKASSLIETGGRDAEIGKLVRLKLTSGNSVLVERCTVTATEVAAITAAQLHPYGCNRRQPAHGTDGQAAAVPALDNDTIHQIATEYGGTDQGDYFFRPGDLNDFVQRLSELTATGGRDELQKKYEDLLYSVASKFLGETRHETALRYIRNAEAGSSGAAAQPAQEKGNE